jgi:hypothetical protein
MRVKVFETPDEAMEWLGLAPHNKLMAQLDS